MSTTVAHEQQQQHAQRQHQPQPQQPQQASAAVTGSSSNSAPSSPTRPRSVSVKHVRVEADETRSQITTTQHTRAGATAATTATATNISSSKHNSSGAHGHASTSTASKSRVSHINVGDERLHLALIQLLGCVLAQLVAFEEQQYPSGRGPISMFHTAYVPSISIGAYLRRVALYTKVSSEVLLQSVLHVHQLMQREVQPLIVNSLNVHRLLLTSILTTAKFFDDAHYNNAYFSYVGGVPLRELNALEVEFLSLLNFDFFVHSSTFAFFYNMCRERSIHGGGCACPAVMDHVPDMLALAEYKPDPDVDFSVPIDHVETAAEPVQQLGSGSMRALNEAIRTLASEQAMDSASASCSASTPTTARLDESIGSTDTDSEELSSASALATPAQRQQRSHSRVQSHLPAAASSSSSSGAATSLRTPRQQQLHVQHFVPHAPPHQQHHRQQQQRSSSPASCASSCFPGVGDSPVSTNSSSLSSLASYTHHSRAHTSHAVPSSGVLAHMQSPSMSRSCSTSVSVSAAAAPNRNGRATAAATPLAADSMQLTPRMALCAADTPTASMMVEDGDAVLKEKHARLDLGLSLTPRMSVVPQEQ